MSDGASVHALTWAWWAVAAALAIQLAPSPTYVVIVILIAALVVEVHGRRSPLARAFPILVAVAAAFVMVRLVLAAVTAPGAGPVWFRLPEAQLPLLLGGFVVGGDVHAHTILRALSDGIVIVGVVAAFAAFNAVVSHHQLVQAAPRAFHELGLVVTVALAFVPSVLAAIGGVREADRARTGTRPRRRGRLVRMAVPVVETGMERAMRLAESMDSRGFAHHGPTGAEKAAGWLALGALASLGGAFAALVGRARGTAMLLGGLGAVLLVAAVVVASRAAARPRYRHRRPGRIDLAVGLSVALAPAALVVLSVRTGARLTWDVATQTLPGFDPLAGLALLALAVPVLLRPHSGPRATPSEVAH